MFTHTICEHIGVRARCPRPRLAKYVELFLPTTYAKLLIRCIPCRPLAPRLPKGQLYSSTLVGATGNI